MKGKFVSVWDGGVKLESPCTVNLETLEVTILQTQSGDGVETLDEEYVEIGLLKLPAHHVDEWNKLPYAEKRAALWYD